MSYLINTGSSFLRLKGPERESDDWPLPGDKVKNGWSYTSIPPYVYEPV
jgi:hypothetical protein